MINVKYCIDNQSISVIYTFVDVSSSAMSENVLIVDSDTFEFRRFGRGADGALLPGSASVVPSATTVITKRCVNWQMIYVSITAFFR